MTHTTYRTSMSDLETIAYRLALYGCDAIRPEIVRAVSRVPEEVQTFAAERCAFLALPDGLDGAVWPGRIATHFHGSDADAWIVLLDSPLPEDAGEAVVAHELAHAFLRHDKLGQGDAAEIERQAAELARAWGFTGYTTDPEHCTRHHTGDTP